ncbi:MAG: hypothetical protein EZS28_028390, partial [Streblomastix strix]
ENRFADYIASILADYDYYISQELTPRISENLKQLFDFKKFNDEITPLEDDDEQEKPVIARKITGKAINIADCPYLAIVDVDTDKNLSEEERNLKRNELIEKIYQSELNVALVKTGHRGLHIYCNMDPLVLFDGNSMVKKITTEKYDVDIFACVDYNESKRCIVLPDQRIKNFEYDTVNKRQQPKKLNQKYIFVWKSKSCAQDILDMISAHFNKKKSKTLIIPITEAEKEIIELKVGWQRDEAQRYCPDSIKLQNFRLQIHKNCETLRQHRMKKQLRLNKFKEDKIAELELYVEVDVNEQIINQINEEQYNS